MTATQQTPHLGQGRFSRPDWRWTDAAACRGEDIALFFGRENERGADKDAREQEAKDICGMCPVRGDCLEEALREAPQYGIWGGMTADERTAQRRNILRRKRDAA